MDCHPYHHITRSIGSPLRINGQPLKGFYKGLHIYIYIYIYVLAGGLAWGSAGGRVSLGVRGRVSLGVRGLRSPNLSSGTYPILGAMWYRFPYLAELKCGRATRDILFWSCDLGFRLFEIYVVFFFLFITLLRLPLPLPLLLRRVMGPL